MARKVSPPDFPDSDVREHVSRNTFHYAIRPFLLMGQFMGVLPVSGLRQSHERGLIFKWTYLGVPVTVVMVVLAAMDLFLSLKVVLEKGLKLFTAGPVTLTLTALLKLLAFFELARQWPGFMKEFAGTEKIFTSKAYRTKESERMCFRLQLNGSLWLIGVFVQHCINVGRAVYMNNYQITRCNLTVNFWENLFIREHMRYFSVFDFHMWMAPLIEWYTVSTMFVLNFSDIFMMLMAMSLAVRFNQIHQRICRSTLMPMTDDYWRHSRLDFLSLLDQLQMVDEHLSSLIVVSCANNLYFICFNIFYSLQRRGTLPEIVYFWYSLVFVFARIFAMMLAAASINDISADTLTAFYEIPTDFWGEERFFQVVSTETVAMSGKRFFFITRRMILAMVGTVVTYELVLLDQVKEATDGVDFCIQRKT